jgi:branched-chain amino acid transport system substrate-binding protein
MGKMKKVTMHKPSLALVLFGVVLLSFAPAHAVTQDEVIIGLNVPLSGPYVLQGKDQLNAYSLAKEEIDAAGGILGKKIRFLIADSKSDAKVSVENAKKFVEQGVDMITGGSSSGVAVAVSAFCQEQKKLFMATLTYSNDTTGKDGHRHTFRETYNAWMSASALGRYLKKRFPNKKYFYVTSDYTWGWTTRDSMKRFTGSEAASDVLIKLGTPLGAPEYANAIQKALDEKADVLVLVLFGRDMIAGLQACTELGVKDKMQVVVPNLELNMGLGAGAQANAGILGAMPWYWEVPYKYGFEKGKAFVDRYRARFGVPPCNGGGTAYTNLMLYKWAVEQTKSFEAKNLIRVLEGHTFVSLKDQETIRPWDHQTIQSVYVVRGRDPKEMKESWDIYDVVEAFSGEDLAPTREENPVKLEPLES